jgi:NADH dehydrogenase FAD-containing subunit
MLKKLDAENYNVVVISPRNFFLFTPLLPSCTTGTIEHRSIMEPLRNILRHKKAAVKFYEADATKIDHEKKVVYISDDSDIKGDISQTEVPYDMLVVAVGAMSATFGKARTTDLVATDLANRTCRNPRCQRTLLLPQRGRGCTGNPEEDHGLY